MQCITCQRTTSEYRVIISDSVVNKTVITWYDALFDRWWLTSYILLNTTPKPQSKLNIPGNRTLDPVNLRVSRQKPTPLWLKSCAVTRQAGQYLNITRRRARVGLQLAHVFENHKSVPIRLQVLRRASLIHNDTYTLDTAGLGFGQECGCYYSTQQCGLVRVHSTTSLHERAAVILVHCACACVLSLGSTGLDRMGLKVQTYDRQLF